jgi:hypothetical protein
MPLLDLAAQFAVFDHRPAAVSVQRQHLGQWTLTVRRDRFAGATTCELRSRSMTVARGAVTFRLGANVRTYQAMYRLDDGPAVSWRANAMALASLGALPNGESLDNPSEGLVAVPLSTLSDTQTITIRASFVDRPRKFKLGDLPAALRAADAVGCNTRAFAEGDR